MQLLQNTYNQSRYSFTTKGFRDCKEEKIMLRHPLLTALLVCMALAAPSCSRLQSGAISRPLDQTIAGTLKPGLIPRYFPKYLARNVDELPEDTSSRFKSWQGEPILQLNHQFGTGEVYGSGVNRGIAIRMRGTLYFPSSGTYIFQALSNDGIKMFLGEVIVVNDPVQHSDQLSTEVPIRIPEAGWYPLRIDYFQRKGTAALKLFWKTPESDTMEIVPESAYGHVPAE